MSLWYCPKCNNYRGPCPANVCPTCGTAMSWATMREPQVVPARVQPVEPAPVTGSAVIKQIRERELCGYQGTELTDGELILQLRDDVTTLFTEVDRLRAALARERQREADLRSALTVLPRHRACEHSIAEIDAIGTFVRAADLDACLAQK